MRTLPSLVLLLSLACAREAPPQRTTPAQKYAGTWEGQSRTEGSDSAISWTSQITAATDSTITGTLAFNGVAMSPIEVRTIQLSDSMIIFEMGPYQSPTSKTEVITRSEGRVSGDSLWGTFVTLPTKGGDVFPGMSVAQWHNAEMSPKPGSEPIRGTFSGSRKHQTP